MWETFLRRALHREVPTGRITLHLPSGRTEYLGDGEGPEFELSLTGRGSCRRLLLNPPLALGELYAEGRLSFINGELVDFLEWVLPPRGGIDAPARPFRRWANPPDRSRQNVEHHYDLGTDFYRLFLDRDLQYSCAYWAPGVADLEAAQDAKKRHIAAKLCLEPGLRVLDIGCGWGGLALHLAREHDVDVVGITLSPSQLAVARERAEAQGLSARVRFALADYRTLADSFDRVVSVGMLEHVGPKDLRTYFQRVRNLLAPGGAAVIHSIGRAGPPRATNPWITKHIFPGGQLPALSELAGPIERSGLWLTDLEVLRLHYAKTLRAWRERFEARAREIAESRGETFVRLWRFYLSASEAAFTAADQVVFQIQLARTRDGLPLTRDYLYPRAAEEAAPRSVAA